MERLDVVILEVDLDEGFPVVIAMMDLDVVEHIAIEIQIARGHHGLQHVGDVETVLIEQQTIPML